VRYPVVLVAVLLVGCGSHVKKLSFVPLKVPPYPGAASPKVRVQPEFQSVDWTLPPDTKPTTVYDWYGIHLAVHGWKVTQLNETGLHAEKGERTLDVGVRGRTLEINQG
jgi:hypothetical protein